MAGTASTVSDVQLHAGERSLSCTNDRAGDPVGGHHRSDCHAANRPRLDLDV